MAKKSAAEKTASNGGNGHGKKPARFSELLPVKLTPADIAKRGASLADIHADIERLENDKKAVTSGIKGQIDSKKQEARDIARAMRSGEETRAVELYEVFEFRTNTCKVFRSDMGTVLRTRALAPTERQQDLFNGKGPDGLPPAIATVGEVAAAKPKRGRPRKNPVPVPSPKVST